MIFLPGNGIDVMNFNPLFVGGAAGKIDGR
jgi:hypothetical protein